MDIVAGFNVLVAFFEHVDILMMVFVRVLGFIMIVPVMSSQNLFGQGRLFLAFTVAIAIFMSGVVGTIDFVDTTPGYVYLILQEFMVGMFMGYVTTAVFNLMLFAGQMMDHQIGFMMVNVMDPMTQIQVPIVGNLYHFMLLAMVVVTGGIHAFFEAFFFSYQVLPIGTAVVIGNERLAWYFVHLMVESMVLAAQIAMPIVGTMMVVNVALGLVVKTVPQLNVFSVGLPLKIILGVSLLYLVVTPHFGTYFRYIFEMAELGLWEVMHGMQPTQGMVP